MVTTDQARREKYDRLEMCKFMRYAYNHDDGTRLLLETFLENVPWENVDYNASSNALINSTEECKNSCEFVKKVSQKSPHFSA